MPGDVADPDHRARLVEAAGQPIDLLVNNASVLGPSPQPPLAALPARGAAPRLRGQRVAPLALVQLALPAPRARARGSSTSPPTRPSRRTRRWGGYGSSKAALAQLTAVLGAEHPGLRAYAVDPGDMRTQMQQEAFPGEDISDRPPPEESVPGLLALIEGDLPSGRYRARDLGRSRDMSEPALRAAAPPGGARAAGGARARARRRAPARRAPLRRRGRPRTASATCRCSSARAISLVLNTSATLPAALPASPRGRHARSSSGSRRRRPASTPPATGSSSSAAATAPFSGGEAGERARRCRAAPARRSWRRTRQRRLWLARLDLPSPLERYLAEHGRPIRYGYVPRRWPLVGLPERLRDSSPGAPRCRAPGGPFTPELITRLVAGGVLVAPLVAAHGRLVAGARRAALSGAVPRAGSDGPARQRGPRLGRARDRRRHDRGARARDGRAAGRHGVGRRGLDEPRRHARARALGRRRPAHRPGTSRRPRTSTCCGRPPATSCSHGATRRRSSSGYRWHEFGDSHLILD